MTIVKVHVPYYVEILGIKNFAVSPMLIFGYHNCSYDDSVYTRNSRYDRAYYDSMPDVPVNFQESTFQDILSKHYGVDEIKILDLFDSRADLQIDMNNPIDEELHQKFSTVIDIGSIEHVFDTKQCLWNLINLVKIDGRLMLHTPCKGYFKHGFYTFHPSVLLGTLELNGFDILYTAYSTIDGKRLNDPSEGADVLIWIVAKKNKQVDHFNIPQQERWTKEYKTQMES